MNPIDSKSNAKFKTWQSLLSSKGIKKEGLFFLSGERLVHEFMKNPNLEISAELIPKARVQALSAPGESVGMSAAQTTSSGSPISVALTTDRRSIFVLSAELFAELDEMGTHYNILVLKTPEIKKWTVDTKREKLEVFCPLGDPTNVGSLLRSCEAFGADSVILSEEAANPFLPKSVKASAGSVLRVSLFRGPKIAELPTDLITLDSSGESLSSFRWPEQVRLLIGEEGHGVKDYKGKMRIQIPTQGVESLNATVAASIALYDHQTKSKG
jgi:RNA methyltransferase, TrmH family